MSIAPRPVPMSIATDQAFSDDCVPSTTPGSIMDQPHTPPGGSKESCAVLDSAIAPPEDAALRMPPPNATTQPSTYRYDSGPSNAEPDIAPVPLKRRILHSKAPHESLTTGSPNPAAVPTCSSTVHSTEHEEPAASNANEDDVSEPMPLSKNKDKGKSLSQPVLQGSGPFTSIDALNASQDRSATAPASPSCDTTSSGMGTTLSVIDLAVRTMSAIRIQHWWRLMRMQQHFRRLKRRESGSAGDSILMQSRHSRAQSTTADPLLSRNDVYLENFNQGEPKSVLHAMRSGPLCDCLSTDALAHLVSFFARNRGKLDRSRLGELFGHPDPLCVTLMRAYINSLDFTNMDFVRALRTLLTHFRLPGEAQKIDRILDQFSVAYHASNPGVFKDAGTAFVLSFSLIMLNTDAHNPAVKRKMSVTDFVRNNRGIDAGGDLPAALLRRLYYEIVCHEIAMDNDESGRTAKVLRGLLGADKVRSAYLGQYSASKVIRGAKHERRLFLFGSHLLIAKPKVPKHQVSQLFELTSITLSKYADTDQDAPFPNSVAVQPSSPTGNSSNSDSNASPGSTYSSDPNLAPSGGDVGLVQLVFESPEERDVFVSNVMQATQAYMRELESIEKYISDRVALTKANLERRYRSSTAEPAIGYHSIIDNSSEYTSPEGTHFTHRPSSTTAATSTTLSATPASTSTSPAAGATGSLRAKRMALQRDAARIAQTLHQTRSMLQSRANSAAVSGRSSLQGSSQNLAGDVQSAASVPVPASPTTANSPKPSSPKFGPTTCNDEDPTSGDSQTQAAAPRGRPATASTALEASRRGSTASSIFRVSRSPSPALAGLSPGTANIPRSPSANGYFLSLPSRIMGSLSRRNRVGSARGAKNLENHDDDVGSPIDDEDAGSVATGGAGDQSQPQSPQSPQTEFRTRYGSQKGLTMEETIPEMSSRRESAAINEDTSIPALKVDSDSRDSLTSTQSSSPPPDSNITNENLWGRRRANSEARRGTIA